MTLVIPILAVPKPRMTKSDKWKKRKCTTEYWAYKDALQKYASDIKNLECPFKITFYMPIPGSLSLKKQCALDGKPHLTRCDVDNLCKGFLDAIYKDDAHIWSVWCEKRYTQSIPCIVLEKIKNNGAVVVELD